MMVSRWDIFATCVEIVGIIVMSCGITLELALRADTWLVVTTIGAGFIALGGLLYAKPVFGKKRR